MAILNSPSSVPAKAGTHDDKALSESVVEKGKTVDDDSDTNSELKQDGVKQVEAVTQAWSPAMMWLVFVLYVHPIDIPEHKLTRSSQTIPGHIRRHPSPSRPQRPSSLRHLLLQPTRPPSRHIHLRLRRRRRRQARHRQNHRHPRPLRRLPADDPLHRRRHDPESSMQERRNLRRRPHILLGRPHRPELHRQCDYIGYDLAAQPHDHVGVVYESEAGVYVWRAEDCGAVL